MTPRRILVILERQIGDNLLATPLVRSLKQAWPESRIDFLTFVGNGGILEGNPDIDRVLEWPRHPRPLQHLKLLRGIWRRYDLAVACQPGDRPIAHAIAAAPRRAALVPAPRLQDRWKHGLIDHPVVPDPALHTQVQLLELARGLNLKRQFAVVPPTTRDHARLNQLLGSDWSWRPRLVLHLAPLWRYKQWPPSHWQDLLHWLLENTHHELALSGGPDPGERKAIDDLIAQLELPQAVDRMHNLAGQLRLAELAELLRRSAAYVGPDTAVTHLAAACDIPCIALFGPTQPRWWGPWPSQSTSDTSPWPPRAGERRGKVFLLQGDQHCVPCHREGCEGHRQSHSACLDELSPRRVIAILESLLMAN